ncbi:uncharacterized protein LOC100891930 isoform X2 [Strongylocentrotus purpuratus]|uniref:FG-GAP repeat-containing protein n=1 Tax=Strongylocentrotus purpuratus TaxID=7668 RepID=A0A7M7N5G0_STRPU|nr:uncharacterized protein LOC100891930 isoform X1 [Strongylocentrotus purpuratus]XP_030831253.1 uncharacterized protein LOC100891930 isoform X2 [Strongylocentrotus purpuratus]
MDKITSAAQAAQQRSFSLRDGVILVILSLMATYLLRVQHSFELVPSWRYEVSTGFYEESMNTRTLKKLPVPLVADIESDGRNEILLTTKDSSLLLLKTSKPSPGLKALPYLNTLDEFSLLSDEADIAGDKKQAVAMATGYLEPLTSDNQVRKQVIVVLCADWTVVCLNSDFKLIWSMKLPNTTWSHQYVMSEAAILILPHSLQSDDGGLVIIGGRLADRLAHATLKHSHDGHGFDGANKESKSSHDVGHFSTFALSGRHGDVRWHHLPGDFGEETNTEEKLFEGFHFKLNLKRGWGHQGELGWNQYNQALLKQMPFRWQSSMDTKIDIAEFRKDGVKKSAEKDEHILSVSSYLTSSFEEHIAGHHFGGLPPHSASEHIKNPNAVIIHSQQGIEVLELKSGRPMTRLDLSPDATYADIDKDGVVDQAKALFTDDGSEGNCQAVVKTGHPPHSELYNGSICYPSSLWAALSYPWAYASGSSEIKENQELSLRPLIVKSVAKRRGIISHLLGLSMSKAGMDTIFTVSTGQVTSYGPQGQFNWQVSTSALWSERYIVKKFRKVDHDLQEIYHRALLPSILPLSIQEFGQQSAAVIAGWDHIVLLSLETGNILAEHTLPCQPTAPVVIGDFDDDGLNDIIVQCSHSYLGFSIQRYSGYWVTAFIGLAVVVIVTTLVATCTPKEKAIEGAVVGDEDDSLQVGVGPKS